MRRNQTEQNNVTFYRRRIGFKQIQVARLLGHRDSSSLSVYESGRKLPRLTEAFKLSIILRVPVEFLFPITYEALRNEIRSKEQDGESWKSSSINQKHP